MRRILTTGIPGTQSAFIGKRDYRLLLAVARAAEQFKQARSDSAFDSPSMWQAADGVTKALDKLNAKVKGRVR